MKAFIHCGPNPQPMTRNEAMALASCALLLPPNPVIIQIGAYIGASTIAMLETRPDAFIFSIDLKPYPQERENLIAAGLDANRVVRVLGDSSQISWPYPVDMLFIDGGHFYEAVKADCAAWLDRVKGYVIFHDYIPVGAPPKNQVARVVREIFGNEQPFVQVERIIGFERR